VLFALLEETVFYLFNEVLIRRAEKQHEEKENEKSRVKEDRIKHGRQFNVIEISLCKKSLQLLTNVFL